MRPKLVFSLLCLAVIFGQYTVTAQEKPDLPTADTVLNQYIEATGGRAAYEKLKNRVSTGTIELPAANIKGTILTQDIVMKLTEIKHNVDLPADAFQRPGKKEEPAKTKQN
jgi:hypothetical protein